MNKKLTIIAGATATGKTEISLEYAKINNGEIISADSMQVYRQLDIGTAKISKNDMQGITHYLIDVCEPDEEFNIYKFKKMADECMNEIYSKGMLPVICGGTGFYIQSVLYDIDFQEENNDISYRNELEEIAESKGGQYLYDELKKKDPHAAEEIHPNNIKRIIRALEFYHMTGGMISEHNRIQKEKSSPYDFKYFIIDRPRHEIYERIEKRVDEMIKQGLVEEVKNLLDNGTDENSQSMQGLGYKEMIQYLKGNISLDEATELIKKNTRHYAKRQITWFKREKDAIRINCNDFKSSEEIAKYLTRLK